MRGRASEICSTGFGRECRCGGKLTGCLDLAAVHREQDARAPVQEALVDRLAHRPEDLADQSRVAIPRGVLVRGPGLDSDFFEEDGNALHGLVAERALGRGELEGVRDPVGKVCGLQPGRGCFVLW